jgi:hypothetical protein
LATLRSLLRHQEKETAPQPYNQALLGIQSQVADILDSYQEERDGAYDMLQAPQGYDTLISKLDNTQGLTLVSSTPQTLSSELFAMNEETKRLLAEQENPLRTYQDTQTLIAE